MHKGGYPTEARCPTNGGCAAHLLALRTHAVGSWPAARAENNRRSLGPANAVENANIGLRPLQCVHKLVQNVYTYPMEVGIRQLRNNLSDYLEQVRDGGEVVVTDRGAAVARIVPIPGGRAIDRLVADGLVTPAASATRNRLRRRVRSAATVSDLVSDQRR
jgi:prevent-host-death family protein